MVWDCFFSPRHAGSIDLNNPRTAFFKSNQKGQGQIEFYMQYDSSDRIERACFKTNGNPYLIASLEWLCRQLERKTFADVPEIDYQVIINELEIPVAQYPTALSVVAIYQDVMSLINKIERL